MSQVVSESHFTTMTLSWCVCAAYRLAAQAHGQQRLLGEHDLLRIEDEATRDGRDAALAADVNVVDGSKIAAISKGVEAAAEVFKKFRRQRSQ